MKNSFVVLSLIKVYCVFPCLILQVLGVFSSYYMIYQDVRTQVITRLKML